MESTCIRIAVDTHQRLNAARLVEGETHNSIVTRALDALEERERRPKKGSREVAAALRNGR